MNLVAGLGKGGKDVGGDEDGLAQLLEPVDDLGDHKVALDVHPVEWFVEDK